MTQIHVLKTLDLYFDAIERGEKTFEVRLNDRAFQTGDILDLCRYEKGSYGLVPTRPLRTIRKRITYLLQGGQFGIEPRHCVMGLGDVEAGHVE